MSPSATSDHLSIQDITLRYDNDEPDASARRLIYALYPEWERSPGRLELVRFKDGITNTLLKAVKRRPGIGERELDEEAVLLRAYGSGTDVLIDREREALSHSLLARYSLAPPLLARFENGLLYKYIAGIACSPNDLRSPLIWPAVARVMGQWHGVMPTSELVEPGAVTPREFDTIRKLCLGKPVPNIWTNMQKWILALPKATEEERERNSSLQRELELSTLAFGNAPGLDNGEYVLSHNDLLSGNVIIHPPRGGQLRNTIADVSFIDYEYAIPGPASFDIANHFAEWGGFDCDFSVLPSRSQRRAFIQQYVRSYRKHTKDSFTPVHDHHIGATTTNGHDHNTASADFADFADIDEQDVELVMREVDDFRGLPGLYWGIWALIQATISDIDFDYATYAEVRLGEYWAWKYEMDGSRKKSGIYQPLRERRWAEEK